MLLHVVKDSKGVDDQSVTVPQMRKMIRNFKMHPEGGCDSGGIKCATTSFANFPVPQILQLLLKDKVISGNQTVDELCQNGNIAVKTYFAQHVEKADCPATSEDYVGYNTVFLVSCVYEKYSKKWNDVIDYDDPENASVIFADDSLDDSGTGTDKANLCPPQCSIFGNKL